MPPPTPPTPTQPAAAVAEPNDPAPAAEPKPEPTREQRAAAALERVTVVADQVTEIRGLPFKSKVPAAYQSAEDFQAYVRKEIAKEMPPDKSRALSRALHHIGLLATDQDIATAIGDAVSSQAAAYYDPTSAMFYLVMVPKSSTVLDTFSSHELDHALQDQHFDLAKYYNGPTGEPPTIYNEDQVNARRFVVEGEATLVMMAYLGLSTAKLNLLAPDKVDLLGRQLQAMSAFSFDQLKQQNQMPTDFDEDGSLARSAAAMDGLPKYVLVPLLESYTKGAYPIFEVYRSGGWPAVNALYGDAPPDSTEQMLHPVEKMVAARDYPVVLSLAPLPRHEQVHSEVLGELLWRVYFMNWAAPNGDRAAAGWDGDRYAVYRSGDRLVGLIATTWDTEADAAEFAATYVETLKARFANTEISEPWPGIASATRGDGTTVLVEVRGRDVNIVDGAAPGDRKLLRHVAKRKAKRDPRDR